ncbi:MAG: hypothetical protein EA427_07040 [Spirochaetaceae bacterium]|nr:MAG: hypothetical protein EA427_07040 [Spirochaetaceae bacterium]
MHGWFGYAQGQFGPMGWVGPIMMILFWGLLIVGIVVLIRYLSAQTRNAGGTRESSRNAGTDALEILRERYARGEIETAEYEEKKRVLE